MAVAVKNASEAASSSALDRLAVSSLLGVFYVLGSIGIVFYAIPTLWTGIAPALGQAFISAGLLILAMAAAAVGLVILGARLVGPNPPHGLRAGVGLGTIGLLAIVTVTWWLGALLDSLTAPKEAIEAPGIGHSIALAATLAVGAALLYFGGRMFLNPKFEDTLTSVEDQGWFSRAIYKGSQGQRVRRVTMASILVLFGCGIATLRIHNTLDSVGYTVVEAGTQKFINDWVVTVPFTANANYWGQEVVLLRDVAVTVPALLAVIGLWIGFRAVNYPGFADFLIATEAEMNKVSWATRKRLVQDTIVVLVFLVILTVFLMFVDLFWGFALTRMKILEMPDPTVQKTDQLQPW